MDIHLGHFHQALLDWYHAQARDLPWRQTKNPYFIWLSEVMLQQTQVKTVIPYYTQFIEAFPSVHDLANASEDQLMRYWQGLGYYRRAKHLHQAAKQIVEQHHGQLPSHSEELIKLKGFGAYTSASVASIAFAQPIACVDGNVKRVMARLFADDQDPFKKSQSLLYEQDPSSYNQAVMELGATLCIPKNPKCLLCPVSSFCKALKDNVVHRFPQKIKKNKVKTLYAAVLITKHQQDYFLQKRTQPGRWENLWEHPTVESQKPLSAQDVQSHYHAQISQKQNLRKISSIEHVLTHLKIKAEVYALELFNKKDFKTTQKGQWFNINELAKVGTSVFQKKALKATLDQHLT